MPGKLKLSAVSILIFQKQTAMAVLAEVSAKHCILTWPCIMPIPQHTATAKRDRNKHAVNTNVHKLTNQCRKQYHNISDIKTNNSQRKQTNIWLNIVAAC